MSSVVFQIPAFEPKPFVWNATAKTIELLKPLSGDYRQPPSQGISSEDANALLEWVVAGTAEKLKALIPKMAEDWHGYAKGNCMVAANAIHDLTQDIDQYQRHLDMGASSRIRHAATLFHCRCKKRAATDMNGSII